MAQRLDDMLEAIAKIRRYTEALDFAAFASDSKTIDAVVRNLELIGEASRRVPVPLQRFYTDAPWERIGDMRNKLIHDYADVDTRMVWQTIEQRLGPLEEALRAMKASLDADDG